MAIHMMRSCGVVLAVIPNRPSSGQLRGCSIAPTLIAPLACFIWHLLGALVGGVSSEGNIFGASKSYLNWCCYCLVADAIGDGFLRLISQYCKYD
eukprot:scaffold8877_cov141-Skeletonema_menzelii.AAC.1